jgi:single-strand DNA-binding protein
MSSINTVALTGRLVRDPEVYASATGKVVSFTIAVDGRSKDDSSFFKVKVFGKSADFVAQYITKGRMVGVDGRLQQRKFTDKQGQQRDTVEIAANNVVPLDKPGEAQRTQSSQSQQPSAPSLAASPFDNGDEYDPFADQ